MKRFFVALAAVAVFGVTTLISPAVAVPPTVTPSPGYDARLQEQRSATTIYTPAPRPAKSRRYHKRVQ
jgi:hypothetical protein